SRSDARAPSRRTYGRRRVGALSSHLLPAATLERPRADLWPPPRRGPVVAPTSRGEVRAPSWRTSDRRRVGVCRRTALRADARVGSAELLDTAGSRPAAALLSVATFECYKLELLDVAVSRSVVAQLSGPNSNATTLNSWVPRRGLSSHCNPGGHLGVGAPNFWTRRVGSVVVQLSARTLVRAGARTRDAGEAR